MSMLLRRYHAVKVEAKPAEKAGGAPAEKPVVKKVKKTSK